MTGHWRGEKSQNPILAQLTWLPFPAGEAQVDTAVREGVIKVKG